MGMARHVEALEQAASSYEGLSDRDLLATWCDTVARFRDPNSPERRRLDPILARHTGLSRPALAAGLDAVLGGVDRVAARGLAEQARHLASTSPPRGLVWVVLAANLPGLVVQPLLPALLCRRTVLIKSSQHEPTFAPTFVEALVGREPRLAPVLAALTWAGGDTLEAPLTERAERVIAYGGSAAIAALRHRVGPRLVPYGPKLSLAVVGSEVVPAEIANDLARDVALFDQQGCLSIQAIYTAGEPRALADALGRALEERAAQWPPGPNPDPTAGLAIRQLRDEAIMRGLHLAPIAPPVGTVVVETGGELVPSPGQRTVRIHPMGDLAELPRLLEPWRDKIQGVSLVGVDAKALEPALRNLGVSHCAPPGELQSPDALWHNGGIPPLAALAGDLPRGTKTPDPQASPSPRLG